MVLKIKVTFCDLHGPLYICIQFATLQNKCKQIIQQNWYISAGGTSAGYPERREKD